MYPKNATSPEPIAIGAVVQISDGAVQTSGCTVRIRPIGVAEGDGGGTTAYSTDGIVYYTPTQAETNYTSFILIAKKTGCIPVALTVVTTSSITPGTVLLAPVTHTSATIPTVSTLTGHTPQTGDSFARIGSTGSGLTSLATAAQINSLQVNTRANLQVPIEIETPDASTQVYKIRLFLFDVEGNMEAPDSTPTISLVNAAGTSRSSRLSVASNPSTGVYSWDYTATAGDAEEQLVWTFTVVEGALTRVYPATSYVVEETAYRFSSTDRATLNAAATQTTALAIKAKTDNLPSDPADQSAVEAAITAALGTGTWATTLPWNAAWDAEVQSEVQDAIEVNHLDHLLAVDYDPASKPGSATALLNELIGNDAGVSQFTANALELAPSGGGGGDATLANQVIIKADLDDIQSRLPAALDGGRMAAVLDTATQTALKKMEAVIAGTVTGAGTSTEVFVGPQATVTVTADIDGNRSAVVVT